MFPLTRNWMEATGLIKHCANPCAIALTPESKWVYCIKPIGRFLVVKIVLSSDWLHHMKEAAQLILRQDLWLKMHEHSMNGWTFSFIFMHTVIKCAEDNNIVCQSLRITNPLLHCIKSRCNRRWASVNVPELVVGISQSIGGGCLTRWQPLLTSHQERCSLDVCEMYGIRRNAGLSRPPVWFAPRLMSKNPLLGARSLDPAEPSFWIMNY